jgi:serine/threonine protein kinase
MGLGTPTHAFSPTTVQPTAHGASDAAPTPDAYETMRATPGMLIAPQGMVTVASAAPHPGPGALPSGAPGMPAAHGVSGVHGASGVPGSPGASFAPAAPGAPGYPAAPGFSAPPGAPMPGAPPAPPALPGAMSIRPDVPRDVRTAAAHVVRGRAYAFVIDGKGMPIELGSGRFAKAYLGEERWLESKTDFRRYVVIKVLQSGVNDEDRFRFQIEKELLERVQGHPNIISLFASGEADDPEFIPGGVRDKIENDFVILERLDMSLEERLKGSRAKGKRDDLLACSMGERLFRVLDYMIPVASAVEYAHLVRNISHRDIKPANILIKLPDPALRGSTLEVRLADFNVAKLSDEEVNFEMTRLKNVPGTLFFQSPEQEMNVIELLVNTQQGSPEVEYFEDFYIHIAKNDTFSLFNRGDQYTILYADRQKKRIMLDRPYREPSETNVRARIQKSVGRPADIYSLGALFYYLISGAYANPKTLYDAFHKFIEYERADENNTIAGYLEHEYSVINSIRAPKTNEQGVEVAPADRFFSYKHYLDGNGELIDPQAMKIIARCMIRNKPDSYCQAHDLDTRGISDVVGDLIDLYSAYGYHPAARPAQLARLRHTPSRSRLNILGAIADFFRRLVRRSR